MSDLCSETVDAEVVAAGEGERVKASTRPDGGVDEPAKVSSQREEGMEATAHMEKDSKTLSSQLIPSSAASSTSSGLTEVSAGPVDVKKLPETEDSEVTCSQSSINSLLEETPSVSTTTMNVSEENGLSMDESLTSTKSDQALSLSDDLQSVEMAEAAVPSLSDDVAGAEMAQAAAPGPSQAVQAYYLVKWITWKEKKTPIITQSENGPCPLLAIMNILFLRWKAKLPAQTEVVTIEDLMAHLGECVLSIKPREKAEGMELNFQQNMSDAMAVLPKLSTGLDVNVRFTGVTDFEYTPECIVFDLLDIPLYHGWLVDPQSPEMVSAVGKLSYNQLVEKIIEYKHSTDSSRVGEGLIAEQFLESTATQLSYHGLCELNTTAKEGELSVFFRNNHFSTMIKHKHVWLSNCQSNLKHITLLDPQGHLYLLVTDQGFLQEDGVVWESLHNVEGDCNFCDSDFRLCHPAQKTTTTSQTTPQQQQMQIDQDYLVAMSLQRDQGEAPGPLSDLELARQLQQEEYQQPQQQQQPQQPQASEQQMRGQAASHHGGRRRGEKKDDTDCSIL